MTNSLPFPGAAASPAWPVAPAANTKFDLLLQSITKSYSMLPCMLPEHEEHVAVDSRRVGTQHVRQHWSRMAVSRFGTLLSVEL